MSEDQDSKTEDPTDKRLEKAREDGDVPSSQEIKSLISLIAALVIVGLMAPMMVQRLGALLGSYLGHLDDIPMDRVGLTESLMELGKEVAWVMVPPVGFVVLVTIIGGLAQTGLMFSPKKITPKLNKIGLISGAKRQFSKQKLVEFLKSLLKIVLVGTVVVAVIVPMFAHPDVVISQDFTVTLGELHWMVVVLLFVFVLSFAVLAIADLLWTRWSHRQKLKMTKQEVKDEHKQSEGDPMVKGRIRALRMKRVRERMMKSVPQASVVVTNPTHYAVALKYDMDTMAAPKLVAKGVDFLAARIREMAEDNDVPIVENPPLARALYASVEIDQDIPPDQYKAVAEVIGFVMRQRQSGGWRPTPKAERERQSAEQTRQRDDGRMF
jgi:flagellar biosynthetic protein FlhB